MVKKFLLICAMVVGIAGMCSSEVWALRIAGGGIRSFGYYELYFTVTGGGAQDKENIAIVEGTANVLKGWSQCLNPGSGLFEINPGQGDIVVEGYTTINLSELEKFGKSTPIITLYNKVTEYAENLYGIYELCSDDNTLPVCLEYPGWPTWGDCNPDDNETYFDLYTNCPYAFSAFENVWGGLECRNKNWTSFAYFMEDVRITGTAWRNCSETDSSGLTPVGDYFCEYLDDQLVLDCSTDTPFAEEAFEFSCNEPPQAFGDEFTTEMNTVLEGNVLDNDSDRGKEVVQTPLTAILLEGPSFGRLTLNSDGSFSYKPKNNWTGDDKFTYKNNDGISDSYNPSEAEVTIHVVPPPTS